MNSISTMGKNGYSIATVLLVIMLLVQVLGFLIFPLSEEYQRSSCSITGINVLDLFRFMLTSALLQDRMI